MTAVIIATNEDGSVAVAPIDATPEMLQNAEQFKGIDQAMQAVGEVLGGEEGSGDEPGPEAQEPNEPPSPEEGGEAPPPEGGEGEPMQGQGGPMDSMMAGYRRANRGH